MSLPLTAPGPDQLATSHGELGISARMIDSEACEFFASVSSVRLKVRIAQIVGGSILRSIGGPDTEAAALGLKVVGWFKRRDDNHCCRFYHNHSRLRHYVRYHLLSTLSSPC